MVSPRKSRKKSLCFSSTVTFTPLRASRYPSITPAGPPPTMQYVVLSLFAIAASVFVIVLGALVQFLW